MSVRWYVSALFAHVRRWLVDDAFCPLVIISDVQASPGEELEEDDAQRKDVRARIDGRELEHLRRHITKLTLEDAGARVVIASGSARDAEIGHSRDAVVVDEDVVGGDIPMHELKR